MRSGSMKNALTSKYCLFIALCATISIMIVCTTSSPSWAAHLKDIRIGEYETFTRIVFELDTPTGNPTISQTPEQVKVVMIGIQPNLERKVPLGDHRHIRDIQMWIRQKGEMSILIQLETRLLGNLTSFMLDDPPRIVLDAYWNTSDSITPAATEILTPLNEMEKTSSDGLSPTPSVFEMPWLLPPEASSSIVTGASEDSKAIAPEASPYQLQLAGTGPEAVPDSAVSSIMVSRQRSTEPEPEPLAPHSKPGLKSNKVLYFLVIALVIIILAIFILIILMFLSRHRWIQSNHALSVSEPPRHQDARNAMPQPLK